MRSTVVLVSLEPEPATAAPYRWGARLRAAVAAGPTARLRVRPRLTVARWPGDIDAASQIADKLVDNAARRGKPFSDGCVGLRLHVFLGSEELRIEVDDAAPAFADFDAVASAPLPWSGLWWVKHYNGRLSWSVKRDGKGQVVGKTVTALLSPTDEGVPA